MVRIIVDKREIIGSDTKRDFVLPGKRYRLEFFLIELDQIIEGIGIANDMP